jgi:hypothetical protein
LVCDLIGQSVVLGVFQTILCSILLPRQPWLIGKSTVLTNSAKALLSDTSCASVTSLVSGPSSSAYCENVLIRVFAGRAPGKTTMRMVRVLDADGRNWNQIPFNARGGGCGGSMRTACIGLRFPNVEQLYTLISVAIEAGAIQASPSGDVSLTPRIQVA